MIVNASLLQSKRENPEHLFIQGLAIYLLSADLSLCLWQRGAIGLCLNQVWQRNNVQLLPHT